jgi:DNA-binding MurR/RpiR family transcriptional regulator
MSFRTVVGSSPRPLSTSEKRVLTVLLGGQDAATFTAAEVASRADTHESTVVRLAQKLGYRGYPELRADLERDAGTSTTSDGFMRANTGYDLKSFSTDESIALAKLGDFISQSELTAAAEALHTARTVYLFGNTSDHPALELLARRLMRLGKAVVTLGVSAKDIAEHVVSFDSSSALVAFALREASVLLPPIVSEAQRRGGATILITDVPGYHFRPAPSHLLASRRASDSEYNTLLIPIALCYALQLAIFHLDPPRYQAVRDTIDDLTRLLGGTDEIPLRT